MAEACAETLEAAARALVRVGLEVVREVAGGVTAAAVEEVKGVEATVKAAVGTRVAREGAIYTISSMSPIVGLI